MNGSGCIAGRMATAGCTQDVSYKTSTRTMLGGINMALFCDTYTCKSNFMMFTRMKKLLLSKLIPNKDLLKWRLSEAFETPSVKDSSHQYCAYLMQSCPNYAWLT